MHESKLNIVSLILISIATLQLILNVTDIVMVFKTEEGILDFLPSYLRNTVFMAYPILLFLSFFQFTILIETNQGDRK